MKQGDIVLIPFPFTDLTNHKVRPALIVSNKKFNASKNLILMCISTKPGNKDFALNLNSEDLKFGKLNKASYFRIQNVFTLEKRLVIKKVATLKNKKLENLISTYQRFLELD